MQDVARAANVHQTTVSLALRNDPRLPEPTRQRIRRVADRLGYRPDPVLAALNFYRSSRRKVAAPATMAFLLNFRDREQMEASHPHRLFVEGGRQQADQMGYRLELFFVDRNIAIKGERVERVLKARGISGVILGAIGGKTNQFDMRWEDFSTVMIESHQLGLSLHMVSSHQLMITREAVRRLHALGYRRIGLAVGERGEVILQNAFTAGYFVEVAQHTELASIPPLLLSGASAKDLAPALDRWARAHDVEVVASNWNMVPAALRLTGWRLPKDIVVASLDLAPDQGSNCGMRQNHRIVGARAVEQLAILMQSNQRGLIPHPNSTFIEGEWVDGSDVPPCRQPTIPLLT